MTSLAAAASSPRRCGGIHSHTNSVPVNTCHKTHSPVGSPNHSMPRRKNQPNNPVDRVAPPDTHGQEIWEALHDARYVGSSHHKSHAGGGYDLFPPVNPLPTKSLCDDLRTVALPEATRLFRNGIGLQMVSERLERGLPARIWSVDHSGEPYVAMLGSDGPNYHGYRLYRDRRQRAYILATWRDRNNRHD